MKTILQNQTIKSLIIQSLKDVIKFSKHKSLFIKFLRVNRQWKPIQINKNSDLTFSVQFQKKSKVSLMIPCQFKDKHFQIGVDKNFQLVTFLCTKRSSYSRYCFIKLTQNF